MSDMWEKWHWICKPNNWPTTRQHGLIGNIIKITTDEINPYHTSIRYGSNVNDTAKIEVVHSDKPLKMFIIDYDEYTQDFKILLNSNIGYISDIEIDGLIRLCNLYYMKP